MGENNPDSMTDLVALRRDLHTRPELSGREERTAAKMIDLLTSLDPHALHTGLGGHGLAAVWRGDEPGRRVLLRCDLDALPIPETIDLPHRSTVEGCSHKCGHDGHMAILVGLARRVAERPPARGEVVLLFQPSEEDGRGAARVLADPAFEPLEPDLVFALHNLPGFDSGTAIVRDGPFAAASTGFVVRLEGATAHAAEPQRGHTPALAVAELIQGVSALPQLHTGLTESAKATVIHARVGEVAFGTSPGEGVVMATLRAHDARVIDRLEAAARQLATHTAAAHGLGCRIELSEPFPPTANNPDANRLVREAAAAIGLGIETPPDPFPWSEDFGHFTSKFEGALFGLGAGIDHPALHHPNYDFPDELIPLGVDLFDGILDRTVRQEGR
jgi:amidohydrolase